MGCVDHCYMWVEVEVKEELCHGLVLGPIMFVQRNYRKQRSLWWRPIGALRASALCDGADVLAARVRETWAGHVCVVRIGLGLQDRDRCRRLLSCLVGEVTTQAGCSTKLWVADSALSPVLDEP